MKIIFVKSAENDSDIFTKNLSADLYKKHLKKIIGEKIKWFPSFLKNIQSKKEVC